jgi:Ca2+-binding RTX toxin-like protein
VTRSVAANTDETATFGLGGTAAAGADYVAPAGSVTFAAGETSREIAIATTGDSLAEGDETLTMALTGATGGGQVSADPAAGTIVDATPTTPLLHVSRGGVPSQEPTTVYDGPVSHLQFQYLGTASAEVVVATASDDFLNLLGGDDAGAGGPGADVLDGGTGSNFLSGGAGQDVFFVDGRDGATTWSTVTDWQAGEQLSVWGWRPGVSQATWVDSAGTEGFRGVTMHGDLDGDGTVDTSVTWSGVTRVQLPAAVEFEGLLWFK